MQKKSLITDIFSSEIAEESSGFLLWQVTNLWQREIKKRLEEFSITHTQFVILTSIYWFKLNNKKSTQILLSQHTKIDPMTISSVLKNLQKRTLVIRKEDEIDTRAKTVEITKEAEEIIKKAIVVVENFDNEFFGILKENKLDFNKHLIDLLKE